MNFPHAEKLNRKKPRRGFIPFRVQSPDHPKTPRNLVVPGRHPDKVMPLSAGGERAPPFKNPIRPTPKKIPDRMAMTSPLIEEQMRTVVVGVADFKISTDPLTYIVTYALGSCLGITFHDERRRIGGLLHAMLPSSSLHSGQKIREAMFLDTGIPKILSSMMRAGAKKSDIRCKVFGGAQLMATDNFFRIGSKNIDMFY